MDTVIRLRQRRNVLVQMQSETDFAGEPCLEIIENIQQEDVIFGPYTTGCVSGASGGCYDIHMTTRYILPIEYSSCMEASRAYALFQCGTMMNSEVAVNPMAQNLCGFNNNKFVFSKAETENQPESTWANIQDGNGAVSGYVSSIHTDGSGVPDFGGTIHLLYYNSVVTDDVPVWNDMEMLDSSASPVFATRIVGFMSFAPLSVLALDHNNDPYIFREGGSATQWNFISFGQVRFFNASNVTTPQSALVYESTPTDLHFLTEALDSSSEILFPHPSGLEWVDASADNYSLIAVDAIGDVYVYGDNTYGQLGIDPAVSGNFIGVLTLLDTTFLFGVPEKVFISNRDLPVSFIITNYSTTYSSGRYNDGQNPPSLLGRTVIGTPTFSLFRSISIKCKKVSIGWNVVSAIHTDDTLWGWGRVYDCALGLHDPTEFGWYYPQKTEVPMCVSFNSHWHDIAARNLGSNAINKCVGYSKRTFIKSSSLFGQNDAGEFSEASYYGVVFETIVTGRHAAFYLDEDGVVYGGGSPLYHFGGSKWISSTVDNPTNTGVTIKYLPQFGMVRNIWAFDQGSAYVDSAGDFYISGDGMPRIDSLGTPSYGYDDYALIPLSAEVVQVVCNEYGMMVRLSNNEVYSWGHNMYFCLAYNGDIGGNPLAPSWVDIPTKINGEYDTISLGHYTGAGISILGNLIMWGADVDTTVYGLFGQGPTSGTCFDLKNDYSDPQLETTNSVQYEVPTVISVPGPTIFSDVTCSKFATFVIVGETDSSYVNDGFRVYGPRWISGDVWGTGTNTSYSPYNPMLFEYTESWLYAGCWRPILYDGWESAASSGYLLERENYIDTYFNVDDINGTGHPDPARIDYKIPWRSSLFLGRIYVQNEIVMLRKCPYVLHKGECFADIGTYLVEADSGANDFEFVRVWYVLESGSSPPQSFSVTTSQINLILGANCSLTLYCVLKYTEAFNTPPAAFYNAYTIGGSTLSTNVETISDTSSIDLTVL